MNDAARARRVARDLSRLAAAVCACMLALSAWTVVAGGRSPVAATTSGSATLSPTSGGSGTTFRVELPVGAACSGDNPTGGYYVQSYMTKAGVDPASLRYGLTGPMPVATGEDFRRPLARVSNGKSYVDEFPEINTGTVSGVPGFTLSVYKQGITQVPAGDYIVGIACTKGADAEQVIDKFWNADMKVIADDTDPLGFRWELTTPASTTTTSTTTSSTTSSTSSTTVEESTTTTSVDESTTTTTVDPATTTTLPDDGTTPPGVSGSGFNSGGPSGAGVVTPSGVLPYTGNSPWSLVIWGALLVVFGRIAVLLGRRPRVLT